MTGIATLLLAAAGATLLSRLLRLPLIPLLLLSGLAVSYLTGGSGDFAESALVLGTTFLLFVAGLELDPRRVRTQRRAAVVVGTAQFAALAILGFVTARLVGFDRLEAGYVALAVPASSTLVGVSLLQRRRQMFEPFGRLTLGVLLLQDVLVLLAIPLVTGVDAGWAAVLSKTGGILLMGALSLAVRRWAAPRLLRVAEQPELILLGALTTLFFFVELAGGLGLPIVVGAFLAGVALSDFPVNGIVRTEMAPIGDFFMAVFFTALGGVIRLPEVTEVWQALGLTAMLLVVTPPLVMYLAERCGFTSTPAIEAGLLLSQTSEISLVVVLAGMENGQIGEDLFVVVAMVTLVTMLTTPFLATDDVARRLARLRPGGHRPTTEVPSDHVLLLGVGSTGMPLLEDLVASGCRTAVVDDDPAVVDRLTEAGVAALRGEASDPEVLTRAGAHRARAITSTIRRIRDNATLLDLVHGPPVLVRVFEKDDARWVRERGGRPVLFTEATADDLLEWYSEHRALLERSVRKRRVL